MQTSSVAASTSVLATARVTPQATFLHESVTDARRLLGVAQAEEEALESLLTGSTSVLEITLRTGVESLLIPVTTEVGWAVVHELLLATIEKREELERMTGAGAAKPAVKRQEQVA